MTTQGSPTYKKLTIILVIIILILPFAPLKSQELTKEEQQKIDAALPQTAPITPKEKRRILVTNLSKRDGELWKGSSNTIIPVHNYAIKKMGEMTRAYEAVFNNDIEMFRSENIKQFDAIFFLNTVGVLFDDPELRSSLLNYILDGGGFIGVHDAIATFVQYPVYDQWPAFGDMLGGTENGGHPWNGELMTLSIEDQNSPLTEMFEGTTFQIADQAFQLQEEVIRDDLHVLLSIDVEKTGISPKHSILPVRQKDLDFPMSWIRSYGAGRVFYLGLGHSAHVFWNPVLLEHLLAGIQFAVGDLEADTTPTPQPK